MSTNESGAIVMCGRCAEHYWTTDKYPVACPHCGSDRITNTTTPAPLKGRHRKPRHLKKGR
jgi:DNA-directed RNA polymerase subunit RPC12/RpoP